MHLERPSVRFGARAAFFRGFGRSRPQNPSVYADRWDCVTFWADSCLHNDVDNSVDNVQNPICKANFLRLRFCYERRKCLTFSQLIPFFVSEDRSYCQTAQNALK